MQLKLILLLTILSTQIFAKHQIVCLGEINPLILKKTSKTQIIKIIKEIELFYESKLNKKILTYRKTNGCKPINLLHIEPSDAKIRYNKLKKILKTKKNKLNSHNNFLKKYKTNPNKTKKLNTIAKKRNKSSIRIRKSMTRISRNMESLSHSFSNVLGVAVGRKIKHNDEYIIEMKKIDIYNFENKNKFKAILAHELGHLIGLGHVESKGSLMNPILQYNQIKKLNLSSDDIKEFKKSF